MMENLEISEKSSNITDKETGDNDEEISSKQKTESSLVSEPESEAESEAESDADADADADVPLDADTDNSESDLEPEEFSEKEAKSKKVEKEDTTGESIKGYLQADLSEYSDSDSDSDSGDEDEFKKLEHSRNLLADTHKNLQSINYIEVEQLSKITRDENNRIIDENHRTVPILSKYERTKILGVRTKQINSGAKPFINTEEMIIDGYTIAERELLEKKIPFIIKRPISNNKFEYWKLEDLEIV